jgi:hypothetical protein
MYELSRPSVEAADSDSSTAALVLAQAALKRIQQLSAVLDTALEGTNNPKAVEINARYMWAADYVQSAIGELTMGAESAAVALRTWGIVS